MHFSPRAAARYLAALRGYLQRRAARQEPAELYAALRKITLCECLWLKETPQPADSGALLFSLLGSAAAYGLRCGTAFDFSLTGGGVRRLPVKGLSVLTVMLAADAARTGGRLCAAVGRDTVELRLSGAPAAEAVGLLARELGGRCLRTVIGGITAVQLPAPRSFGRPTPVKSAKELLRDPFSVVRVFLER